ncbi:LOW QUALITY PROTEIN: 60S ribosomal protein L6 [Galemys pyrenaicus]|uniref:60S ribosomal protein L6 n=1 Tax=Galemys pyrenaicus TaxID=202257 RepID=A0A8J5ZWU3_GALPY|nr:LOW QUALITY PROTEIN: 60S ribosomal protein L6 [Galemys pyrenaicus]
MVDEETEKLTTKHKKFEARKVDADEKGNPTVKPSKRGSPTAAEILSYSEELTDIPVCYVIKKKPSTRGSIWQLNLGLKRKRRRFLILSQKQLLVIRVVKHHKIPQYSPQKAIELHLKNNNKKKPLMRILGASITPRTILIMLTESHRGKRVSCWKQLSSDQLLGEEVTGNPDTKREREKNEVTELHKVDQKVVDSQILSKISYSSTPGLPLLVFALASGIDPHKLMF